MEPDFIDVSKITPEQARADEEKLLSEGYICTKCKSLHFHNTNLEGKVCFPHAGKYQCDGIMRRMISADIDEMVGK
jgi:hypothetical protein